MLMENHLIILYIYIYIYIYIGYIRYLQIRTFSSQNELSKDTAREGSMSGRCELLLEKSCVQVF